MPKTLQEGVHEEPLAGNTGRRQRIGQRSRSARRIRPVSAAQTFVTLLFLALGARSTTLRLGQVTIGVISAVVGGAGCALALSTGVQQRYLEAGTRSR